MSGERTRPLLLKNTLHDETKQIMKKKEKRKKKSSSGFIERETAKLDGS